jgi:purine-binding chemotaxis protein CheW
VRYGKEKIGFLIDDIKEILSLPPEEIRTPPSIFKGFKTEYLTGLGKHGDSIIILLNIDSLLTSEERIKLMESIELLEEKGAGVSKTTQ